MPFIFNHRSALCAALAATALAGCTSTYTGPVEVTRFVAENPAGLGQGPIRLQFLNEELKPETRTAFAAAIAQELSEQGYELQVVSGPAEGSAAQIASIDTTRNPIASTTNRRGPVSVGVGGGTGGFGRGVGVGLGINLGGGQRGPNAVTQLSVRITSAAGVTLWEGRAEQAISVNSDYADVNASAQALTKALFRDFPGGNGETISVDVDDL
ncbi:MAG: hypothetical protein AAGL10_14605 [Pseudomonadota bacterium]